MENKYKYLILITLIFSFITYGFIKVVKTEHSSAQQTPEQEILGIWIMQDEPNNRIEFTVDGHSKIYINNNLESDDLYSISNQCGGSTSTDNSHFLKTIDGEDGTEYCEIINGINENNSNILSLTTDNGKLIIYVRP